MWWSLHLPLNKNSFQFCFWYLIILPLLVQTPSCISECQMDTWYWSILHLSFSIKDRQVIWIRSKNGPVLIRIWRNYIENVCCWAKIQRCSDYFRRIWKTEFSYIFCAWISLIFLKFLTVFMNILAQKTWYHGWYSWNSKKKVDPCMETGWAQGLPLWPPLRA